MAKWVTVRNIPRAAKPTLPGVWKRRDGGFVIRGEARDPRTGKTKEVHCVLPNVDAPEAYRVLQAKLKVIRGGIVQRTVEKIHFHSFAVSLFRSRVDKRKIKSAATVELWKSVLENHLLTAKFAALYVDAIQRSDIEQWADEYVTPLIASDAISPHTANSWQRILKTIVNAAVAKYELGVNPVAGLEPFDTRGIRSITAEQPNSLLPEELGLFLATLKEMFPQHYAFTLLGFITGLRPSSMRPLRRELDVLWNKGAILIRQSETRGEVMSLTKTDEDQKIALPLEVMDVLRWHVTTLRAKQKETGLLFPSVRSGFLCATLLTKPFEEVAGRRPELC